MKKSFKRSIAVILSVLMVIASLPFTAFAAAGEYEPNVVMQYGTIFDSSNWNSMHDQTVSDASNVAAYSAIKGPALDYSNGTLTLSAAKATPTADMVGFGYDDYEYTVGDYFTATVRVDNISQLAAFSMAVSYSNSIEPAGIYDNGGTLSFYGISEVPEGATAVYEAGQPLAFASANAVYPGINGGLVGDISYINTQDHYIMAQASATDGSDAVDVSAGTASADFTDPTTGDFGYTYAGQVPVATFIFKIVTADPIQFSVYDTDNTKLPEYSGGLYIANDADGTAVSQYTTYAASTEATGSALMTMNGENENNGTVTPKYLITFKSHDGTVLSSQEYAEGSQVTIPDLPAKEPDADYHYSVAWNQVPSATADANAEYIAVATPVAHTFDEGVVSGSNKVYTCSSCHYQKFEEIKECTHNWVATGVETVKTPATCKATGLKEVEYKCSLCQETKVETEEIAKTAHTYGAYVYNGDAVRTSATVYKDGTQTRTCAICGNKETITAPKTGQLARKGFVLTVDSAILIKAVIEQDVIDYYDEAYLVAIKRASDGTQTETITDYKSEVLGGAPHYTFTYKRTNPQTLNEQVEYTFYGVKNGVTYWGTTINYAVTDYIVNQFAKYNATKYPTTYTNFRRMLADIIWYGYQGQLKSGYGINNGLKTPMIDYITADELNQRTQGSLSLTDISNASYETIDNPIIKTGATLRFSSSVDLTFIAAKNTAVNMDTLQFEIRQGTSAPVVYTMAEYPEMFEYVSGNLYFYYDGVKVNNAGTPVLIRVLDENGNPLSNTRRYSIESYCAKQISTNGAYAGWCDATMRYAQSATAYFANTKA